MGDAAIVPSRPAPTTGRRLTPDPPNRALLIGAVGNVSVQYNLSCLAIAVECLTTPALPGGDASIVEPAWAKQALLGVAFAGAIVGMVVMGWIGDRIGRRRGMMATLTFVVAGALGSALLVSGAAEPFFAVLCACRLVLGFGVGGIYPMAAATAHEGDGGSVESSPGAAAARVGWAFFWQAPGGMLPYLLAVCLTTLTTPGSADAQFRVIVGFGAVVAAIPLVAACYAREVAPPKEEPPPPPRTLRQPQGTYSEVQTSDAVEVVDGAADPPAPLFPAVALEGGAAAAAAVQRPPFPAWLTLVGTGGTWFLYDVVFYSTSLFTPQIVESIFGDGEGVVAIAWESLLVTALGIPACAAAIWVMGLRGGRWLSIWGFVFIAVAFAGLAGALTAFPERSQAPGAKLALLATLTVALNGGPNVSTYVLPASAFRRAERGFYHGLSAAAGKAGAALGAFIFPPLVIQVGLANVLWMQVGVALLGAAVSVAFLQP